MPEVPYKRTQDSVTSLIQEEMKRHNVQGLSIAIVDDQKIIWAQGFGYADVNNRIPAKPGNHLSCRFHRQALHGYRRTPTGGTEQNRP